MIDADAAAAMSLDDHRHGFAAAVAALLAEFNAYLDRDGPDPIADSVGYRQGTLWLSSDELAEMIAALRDVLASRTGNNPRRAAAPPPEHDPVPDRGTNAPQCRPAGRRPSVRRHAGVQD